MDAVIGTPWITTRASKKDDIMKYLATASLSLALALLAVPATAASVGNLDGLRQGAQPAAEQVAWRRCWWHHGHRHCRWVHRGYGYGPGVNLYFGGHRHGWHRGWGYRRHW
jgi:hypothetical protein